MADGQPLRESPEYLEAVIGIKPQVDDHRDIRIRQIIRDSFLQQEWAKCTFSRIREQQIGYIKQLVKHVGNTALAHEVTQDVVRTISNEMKTVIEEGEEHLTALQGAPVVAATNHLGTYKLSAIDPQRELGEEVPKYEGYNFMYPFPLYFAALSPVADALGNNLSYSSIDYPGIFGQIHTDAGFIHIPPASQVTGSRTELLKEQTAALFERQPNTLLVNFPEGGTGGKYNETGPYDLRTFRTGVYVITAELGLPMLTVAQYFDPHEGMRLKVFEPFYPSPGDDRDDFHQMANEAQSSIQAWLNHKEQA